MEKFDPIFSVLAFFGVIVFILGTGWFLRNRTPLGDLAGTRPNFAILGIYRLDSKNKVCVFTLDNQKYVVLIGLGNVCLLDKHQNKADPDVEKEVVANEIGPKNEFSASLGRLS